MVSEKIVPESEAAPQPTSEQQKHHHLHVPKFQGASSVLGDEEDEVTAVPAIKTREKHFVAETASRIGLYDSFRSFVPSREMIL